MSARKVTDGSRCTATNTEQQAPHASACVYQRTHRVGHTTMSVEGQIRHLSMSKSCNMLTVVLRTRKPLPEKPMGGSSSILLNNAR